MELESSNGQTGEDTLGIGFKENRVEREQWSMEMEEFTQVTGLTIFGME